MADSVWSGVSHWSELMTTDTDSAREFYGDVVGLTTSPMEGGPFPYTLWVRDGKPVGGLIPSEGEGGWPSGDKPHWVVSFVTEDIQRSVEQAEALGGAVLVPVTAIPQFGQAAVLRDPAGAVFGVFQQA